MVLIALLAATTACLSSPDIGHLRHVQWLEPDGEVMRIATASELPPSRDERPGSPWGVVRIFALRDEGKRTVAEAEVRLPFPTLLTPTWAKRVAWRVIEAGEQRLLYCFNKLDNSLHVIDFATGEELEEVRPSSEIHDALLPGIDVEAPGAHVLTSADLTLELLEISAKGERAEPRHFPCGLRQIASAAFERDFSKRDAAPETPVMWVVGRGKDGLQLARASGETPQIFALPLGIQPEIHEPIRLAASRNRKEASSVIALDAMRAASPGTARNRKLFWRQP